MVIYYTLLIVLLCFSLLIAQHMYTKDDTTIKEKQELNLTQIRYKINTRGSICIKDKLKKNLCMYIYPIDFKSARINIPSMGIDKVHRCKLSLLSEIMDIIDNHNVEVFDGNYT